MKPFLLSFAALLALSALLQAAEPPSLDKAKAMRLAQILALAQQQAGGLTVADVLPHSPNPPCPNCQCGCTTTGSCTCKDCDHPLLTPPAAANPPPVLRNRAAAERVTYIVISRTNCRPCAQLKLELKANACGDEFPDGVIYTDNANMEAIYNVTAFPTVILQTFVSPPNTRGRQEEVGRHVGYISAADLLKWINDPKTPIADGDHVRAAVAAPVYRQAYRPVRYAACVGSS